MQMRRGASRGYWLATRGWGRDSAGRGGGGRTQTQSAERAGRCRLLIGARRVPDPADWPLRSRAMFSKGVKRKRSEAEMDSPGAPSSSLFSLSLSKLHRSLQHVEPDLRPLVLVANTLRRIQDEMQSGPTAGAGPQGSPCPTEPPHSPPDGCRTLPPLDPQGEEVLLSNLDASLYASISTTLEDLSPLEGLGASPQLEELPATAARPEPDRTSPPCLGPLELLGPSGYLLEDSLEEDIFEDIDTSMYDSDQWPPAKACPGPGEGEGGQPDLSDLDYLMDVLVGAQN